MLTTLYSLHSNSCSTAAIQFEFVLPLANSRVFQHLRVHLRVPPIALLLPPRTAFERTHTLPQPRGRNPHARRPAPALANSLCAHAHRLKRGLGPPTSAPPCLSPQRTHRAHTRNLRCEHPPRTPHSAYIAAFEHTHAERPLPPRTTHPRAQRTPRPAPAHPPQTSLWAPPGAPCALLAAAVPSAFARPPRCSCPRRRLSMFALTPCAHYAASPPPSLPLTTPLRHPSRAQPPRASTRDRAARSTHRTPDAGAH
ncbi:hypothetical protein C8F04DRAFT_1305377 [Mycena alexandri]|uniref:Uncharacterized protein n=1 Tax=Mycena alexandri TaxID=1745969 RepID=A0AAD6S8X5_9AGAR|nr:hypothetical protein C8F04DRAFT_1305377 [Mycena alexandri]